MAQLPTPEALAAQIIRIMKEDYKARAGVIVPLPGIQTKLGISVRADDINAAVAYMLQEELIEGSRGKFIKLTDKGYGEPPSNVEVQRAVLAVLKQLGIRSGDVLPLRPISQNLMTRGYTGDEIADALEALVADGRAEDQSGKIFLTDKGFAAI
jgi:hypothetical protein